jgi:hypothetical protein
MNTPACARIGVRCKGTANCITEESARMRLIQEHILSLTECCDTGQNRIRRRSGRGRGTQRLADHRLHKGEHILGAMVCFAEEEALTLVLSREASNLLFHAENVQSCRAIVRWYQSSEHMRRIFVRMLPPDDSFEGTSFRT